MLGIEWLSYCCSADQRMENDERTGDQRCGNPAAGGRRGGPFHRVRVFRQRLVFDPVTNFVPHVLGYCPEGIVHFQSPWSEKVVAAPGIRRIIRLPQRPVVLPSMM